MTCSHLASRLVPIQAIAQTKTHTETHTAIFTMGIFTWSREHHDARTGITVSDSAAKHALCNYWKTRENSTSLNVTHLFALQKVWLLFEILKLRGHKNKGKQIEFVILAVSVLCFFCSLFKKRYENQHQLQNKLYFTINKQNIYTL